MDFCTLKECNRLMWRMAYLGAVNEQCIGRNAAWHRHWVQKWSQVAHRESFDIQGPDSPECLCNRVNHDGNARDRKVHALNMATNFISIAYSGRVSS